MPGAIPVKVHVSGAHSNHHAALEARVLTGKDPLIVSRQGQITVSINEFGQYIIGLAKPAGISSSGFKWQEPNKELDTTKGVSKDTFVYITAGNVLVQTGMTDVVSNELVVSCEGIWQAAVDVPPASGGKYNVPRHPYIGASGAVTGSAGNVKGDLDTDGIVWIYWGQVAC